MNNLSPLEWQILGVIRDLKPHERIEIIMNPTGNVGSILVKRSQKLIISAGKLTRLTENSNLETE